MYIIIIVVNPDLQVAHVCVTHLVWKYSLPGQGVQKWRYRKLTMSYSTPSTSARGMSTYIALERFNAVRCPEELFKVCLFVDQSEFVDTVQCGWSCRVIFQQLWPKILPTQDQHDKSLKSCQYLPCLYFCLHTIQFGRDPAQWDSNCLQWFCVFSIKKLHCLFCTNVISQMFSLYLSRSICSISWTTFIHFVTSVMVTCLSFS